MLRLLDTRHLDPEERRPGAFGTDVFDFCAVTPGETAITASAQQTWEEGETIRFTLGVTAR